MEIYTGPLGPELFPSLKSRIQKGEVGIFPTDTIYGLSGNALDERVIERVLQIKGRKTPFSIIPHSLDWVKLLLEESQADLFSRYMGDYKGRYSTLWRYSGHGAALPDVLRSTGMISIRLPDHWIADFAHYVETPLITTSVNLHEDPPMTSLENLSATIRQSIDFIVYEGPLTGPPSDLVHCYEGFPFRIEKRR